MQETLMRRLSHRSGYGTGSTGRIEPFPSSWVAACVAIFSCAPVGATGHGSSAPARPLASYEGRATELFDDGIGAQGIGIGADATVSLQERELVRDRTHMGDAVLRVRVVSLTSTQDEGVPRWLMGVQAVERLAGDRPAPDNFTLVIDGRAPGAKLLRALDGQIIGAPLVAFVREFAAKSGDGEELHFHLAGDGKDEVDAVRVAALDAP
jgi:hypothetical protein